MATSIFCLKPITRLRLEINPYTVLFPVFALLSLFASSQNISGIVNSYYRVIEVIPAKACVRLNSVAGLSMNDKAMIVQMKGASINTADVTLPTFGDTTSLNNAGNYEIGDICYIRGDSVFFVYMLLNQYSPGAFGKVQLVRIPEYASATVTDTLRAAPWDSVAATGGVLAIFVNDDLTLNAPISADSSGFRGGRHRLSGSSCSNSPGANNYAYPGGASPTQNGAYKGEGVADIIANQNGGRGAIANGGGGGNNHNNGGGGGANLSAGGIGGGNSTSGTFNCRLSIQGRGGKALNSYGGKKIFPGGGGGAGHVNNGFAATNGGGHGGGIIFIHANNIISNNQKISANGKIGGPSASDGASGGGAGGTIIMDITTGYSGTLTIQADGGQGGTSDDGLNEDYCYGAGGGGSGGVVYFSGSTPGAPVTTTATAGPAGPEVNHDVSCQDTVLSGPGSAGVIIPGYTYTHSVVLANTYCSVLLPVELNYFNARYNSGQVALNWKVGQSEAIDRFIIERSGENNRWAPIHQVSANDAVSVYSYIDASPLSGYNLYRLKIIKDDNKVVYSSVQRVFVPGKNENITIYPNPAHKKIVITGISSSPEISLLDLSGKLIWQKKVVTNQASIEVELPSLPLGVYTIKINQTARKLIIQ